MNKKSLSTDERDPELLWKKERHHWNEQYQGGQKTSFIASLLSRIVMSSVLFGMIVLVYRSDQAWAVRVQHYISQSLHKEMDFQAAESWYVSHFGDVPTIIPIFKDHQEDPMKVIARLSLIPPLHGTVTTLFTTDHTGIEITPFPDSDSKASPKVKSIAKGRIIEVKNIANMGKVLTIQHVGGLVAIYGHMDTSLKVNDWVLAGDSLGWLSSDTDSSFSTLFFALKQGDIYVDPVEVMSID
ncbi:peptidoglycan DD-metalloendopeptidase family protein [Paenibacillus sp. CMAA1364]